MKRNEFSLMAAGLVASLFLLPVAGGASANIINKPNIKIDHSTSSNWSGYAALTSLASPQENSVSDVKGTWVVPAVTGNSSSSYSSAWVGIDGYSDGSVEQIGTEQDWINGAPSYYAWFEMYPKFPVKIKTIKVGAGDTISAEVSYSGKNRFLLTINDLTTEQSYITVLKAKTWRTSAEWIVEAPSNSKGELPLTDFGSLNFKAASATIDGHTGTIGDPAWQDDPITMINSAGNVKAQPTPLFSDGGGFGVNWLSS